MLIDLHVYTSPGGGPSLDTAIKNARALGLGGIAVCDHRASADVARRVAAEETDGFPVFVGVELPTTQGDMLLFVPELDPFMTCEEWKELDVVGLPSYADVRDLAHRHGGVVLSAQPYDRKRNRAPGDRIFTLDGLASLEVWSSTTDRRAVGMGYEAATRSPMPGFAGSATLSHSYPQDLWVTLFRTQPHDQQSFVEALRAGDYWPVELASGGSSRQGNRRNTSRRPRN